MSRLRAMRPLHRFLDHHYSGVCGSSAGGALRIVGTTAVIVSTAKSSSLRLPITVPPYRDGTIFKLLCCGLSNDQSPPTTLIS